MKELTRHIHLELIGGAAGDMFAAALLDAFPNLSSSFEQTVKMLEIEGLSLLQSKVTRSGFAGSEISITRCCNEAPKNYREMLSFLNRQKFSKSVKEDAKAILTELAKAEARVHDIPLEDVHFHEISDWDTIVDILLAAVAIEELKVDSISVGKIPLGGGTIQSSHGIIPLPSPATCIILEGYDFVNDDQQGERVTPTGASIIKHYASQNTHPAGKLEASGFGFGSKEFEKCPNYLHITTYTKEELKTKRLEYETDMVSVFRFEVDDQTPEDLAIAVGAIQNSIHVKSVTTSAAQGKKNRFTFSIEVISEMKAEDEVANLCFSQTSTIGLRITHEKRLLLPRYSRKTKIFGRDYDVKIVSRPGEIQTAKIENDQISNASEYGDRQKLRSASILGDRDA